MLRLLFPNHGGSIRHNFNPTGRAADVNHDGIAAINNLIGYYEVFPQQLLKAGQAKFWASQDMELDRKDPNLIWKIQKGRRKVTTAVTSSQVTRYISSIHISTWGRLPFPPTKSRKQEAKKEAMLFTSVMAR